jgi:hypothetical protein
MEESFIKADKVKNSGDFFSSSSSFWQYWGLNSWPHACLAGVLPLESL